MAKATAQELWRMMDATRVQYNIQRSREIKERLTRDFLIIPDYYDCDVGYTFFNEKHISVGVAIHIARQEDIAIQITYDDRNVARGSYDSNRGLRSYDSESDTDEFDEDCLNPIKIATSFGYAQGYEHSVNHLQCIPNVGWTIMDTYRLLEFVLNVATIGIPRHLFVCATDTNLWQGLPVRTDDADYGSKHIEQTIRSNISPLVATIAPHDNFEVVYNLDSVIEKCVLRLYRDGALVKITQLVWDRRHNVFPEHRVRHEEVSELNPNVVNTLLPICGHKLLRLPAYGLS
jgi:hypothetical protein